MTFKRKFPKLNSCEYTCVFVAIAIKNGEPEVIGHLYCYQFESRIPRDLHYDISWETYKLKLNLSLFRDGLP